MLGFTLASEITSVDAYDVRGVPEISLRTWCSKASFSYQAAGKARLTLPLIGAN
jgi:hypothetical protein